MRAILKITNIARFLTKCAFPAKNMVEKVAIQVTRDEARTQVPLLGLTDRILEAIKGKPEVDVHLEFLTMDDAAIFHAVTTFQTTMGEIKVPPMRVVLESMKGYSGAA